MGLTARVEKDRLQKAGYVEYPGGPLCGNCSYHEGTRCTNPAIMATVDLANGCCDKWEAGDGAARSNRNEQQGPKAGRDRSKEDDGDARQAKVVAQEDQAPWRRQR